MDTAVTRPLGRLTAGRVAPPQLMLTVSGLLLWKSHHRYPFTLSCCLDRAQPHFSDWLTTRGLRGCAVSCMQTYYWSSLSPLTVMLCINVCVQKLLHPVWVRLKVKGFKDRFVPPVQTFPVSPVSPDMTVVLSWSGFFCDSTDKMKGILRRMNKSPLVWDQLIHHNVMIRVCGRFTQRGDATLQRPWMLLLIKSHLDGWRG